MNDDSKDYYSVRLTDEIRQQIEKFNCALRQDSYKSQWVGQKLRSSRYWVYDSATGNFGLSKFVGYYPVDPVDYINGSYGEGPWMNGGGAKRKIESVTGKSFNTSDETLAAFRIWIDNNLAANAEDDLDFQKIKFLII